MKTLLRALPDVVRLVARLATDPVLPRAAKIALAAAVVYLMSPIDLIPDFVPFVGYLDDALVAAVVLDGVLNFVDRGVVLRYWTGSRARRDCWPSGCRAGSRRACSRRAEPALVCETPQFVR